MIELFGKQKMNPSDFECVELVDVWGWEYASDDVDDEEDDERPVRIMGAARSFWDEICRRVASTRPTLRVGEIYGDGNICGVDWWLSQHWISQYIIATCLRQPRFLQEHGLVLVPMPGTDVPGFAIDTSPTSCDSSE